MVIPKVMQHGVQRASSALQYLEGRFGTVSLLTRRSQCLSVSEEVLAQAQRSFDSMSVPDVDAIEQRLGFAVDRKWLTKTAWALQVTAKASGVNYSHGRLIYSILRARLSEWPPSQIGIALDIGTAIGFSAIVAARAIADSGRCITVISLDTLPHFRKRFWGTADDLRVGLRTREEIVSSFRESQGIVFINETSRRFLAASSLPRTPFAFVDGAHDFAAVRYELQTIASFQVPGDQILLDDASEQYPGVLRATELMNAYTHQNVDAGNLRSLRLLTRAT